MDLQSLHTAEQTQRARLCCGWMQCSKTPLVGTSGAVFFSIIGQSVIPKTFISCASYCEVHASLKCICPVQRQQTIKALPWGKLQGLQAATQLGVNLRSHCMTPVPNCVAKTACNPAAGCFVVLCWAWLRFRACGVSWWKAMNQLRLLYRVACAASLAVQLNCSDIMMTVLFRAPF